MAHRAKLTLQAAKCVGSGAIPRNNKKLEVNNNSQVSMMHMTQIYNKLRVNSEPQVYVPTIKFRYSAFNDVKPDQKRISSRSMSWSEHAAHQAASQAKFKLADQKPKPKKQTREDWEMPRRHKMNRSIVLKPKQEFLSIAAPK